MAIMEPYCIPLNRCSSLLAGFFASFGLTLFFGQKPPSPAQIGSAGLLVMALLLLSPFHHVLERALDKFTLSFARAYRTLLNIAVGRERPLIDSPLAQPMLGGNAPATRQGMTGQEHLDRPRRIFLFVCSGNTCRSPMAAAISNAEIAARLQIPFEALETVNVHALSAGISAKVGAPLTPEAQEVLRSLNVPVRPHAARNLTVELAHQAEVIFCMTGAHRKAVIEMIPAVAWKTYCLDPEVDLDDPIGMGLAVYANCARRIQSLVRLRFDEISLRG